MFLEIIDTEERFELPVGESVLELRRLPKDVLKDIRKRHTREKTEFVSHQPVRVKTTDEEAVNDDILDYVITGWRQVKHPLTKADVECSKENKLRIPGRTKLRVLNACEAENLDEAGDTPEPGELEEEPVGNS